MSNREMVNYWETIGFKFFNDTVKEGHIKFNTTEQLRKLINDWIDVYNPTAERV